MHGTGCHDARPRAGSGGGFRHEALLYAGEAGFCEALLPFLRDGLAAGEPALVAVGAGKIARLRSALGEPPGIVFADMATVGENPGAIISFWRDFADEHRMSGRGLRSVGEPVWAERTPEQLLECQLHESLLNLAFRDEPAFWLVCPYDVETLAPDVLEEAARSHPTLVDGGEARPSATYDPCVVRRLPPLDDGPPSARGLAFDGATIGAARRLVAEEAAQAGMVAPSSDELVLAVSELVANSVRHGGGAGYLRVWAVPDALVCDVRDAGTIAEPLAGRRRPRPGAAGGFGLWLVHRLCDLVQVRTSPDGTAVRVRKRLG